MHKKVLRLLFSHNFVDFEQTQDVLRRTITTQHVGNFYQSALNLELNLLMHDISIVNEMVNPLF